MGERNATLSETAQALLVGWLLGLFIVVVLPFVGVALLVQAILTGNTGSMGAMLKRAVLK